MRPRTEPSPRSPQAGRSFHGDLRSVSSNRRSQTVPRHNFLRAEPGNLESDLHGSWKREFSEPYNWSRSALEAAISTLLSKAGEPHAHFRSNLTLAIEQVHATGAGTGARMVVESFFDEPTNTVSYVLHDPVTKRGALIDSVLDFECQGINWISIFSLCAGNKTPVIGIDQS
jgi:hypothetical protein